METFQFKQLYLNHSISNCLMKKNDIEKCKAEGSVLFKNIINGLLKGVDKI